MDSRWTKNFFYDLSQLFFQWSLVYMLVLFFLEDLKPFFVSSKFSPHWLILPTLLSAIGLLRFAKYSDGKAVKKFPHKLNRLDSWAVSFLSVIISLLWFIFLKSRIGYFGAFLVSFMLYFLIKKLSYIFFKN